MSAGKGVFSSAKREWSAYVFILPSTLMFLLFVLYPMLLAFGYSFQERSLISSQWVGLSNYVYLATDPAFHQAFTNTVLFVVVLVPVVTLMSFLAATHIGSLKHGFQIFFRAAFYLPVVVSGVIVSVIWLWIFNPSFGLLTFIVRALGGTPDIWLASRYTIFYLMGVVFTFVFGIPFIVYMAAVNTVPQELYEVAAIDGAKKRTVKWNITFPLLKPVTFFVMVTQTTFIFQVFVVVQLLTAGGPARSTETIVFQLYREAFRFNRFGRASAMGIVLLVIITCIAIVQRRYAGRDVEY